MTFLKKLRDAAMECSNPEYRQGLRSVADLVELWIGQLYADPSEEKMTVLNSVWAMAERMYQNIPVEGDPAPLSGSPEPARLTA